MLPLMVTGRKNSNSSAPDPTLLLDDDLNSLWNPQTSRGGSVETYSDGMLLKSAVNDTSFALGKCDPFNASISKRMLVQLRLAGNMVSGANGSGKFSLLDIGGPTHRVRNWLCHGKIYQHPSSLTNQIGTFNAVYSNYQVLAFLLDWTNNTVKFKYQNSSGWFSLSDLESKTPHSMNVSTTSETNCLRLVAYHGMWLYVDKAYVTQHD